jgi:hypothetical protein
MKIAINILEVFPVPVLTVFCKLANNLYIYSIYFAKNLYVFKLYYIIHDTAEVVLIWIAMYKTGLDAEELDDRMLLMISWIFICLKNCGVALIIV